VRFLGFGTLSSSFSIEEEEWKSFHSAIDNCIAVCICMLADDLQVGAAKRSQNHFPIKPFPC
jgi:hypothetical protein